MAKQTRLQSTTKIKRGRGILTQTFNLIDIVLVIKKYGKIRTNFLSSLLWTTIV
jgi:hypothetical protein